MRRQFLLFSVLIFSNFSFAANELAGCQKIVEETSDYTHCLSKVAGYPRPVHLYIPKNLDRSRPVNMNIHFHGFNLEGHDHFDKSYGDYGKYLAMSKHNTVLIIPESTGKCETYDSFFSSSKNTFSFLENSKKLFSPVVVSSLSFSGHSGAFKVLDTIFSYPKLEEVSKMPVTGVALFDATYGPTVNIESFAVKKLKEGKSFLFYDSYLAGRGGSTEMKSKEIKLKIGKISTAPEKNLIAANRECLNKIEESILDKKIGDLSLVSLKYLIDARFKFFAVPNNKNKSMLNEHFGILKNHGLSEYLSFLDTI